MAQVDPNLLAKPLTPEEQPIINSPFYPPEYHWPLNSDTKAFAPVAPGRRTAQNMPPGGGFQQGQENHCTTRKYRRSLGRSQARQPDTSGSRRMASGRIPGTTTTTKDLINHWTDREEFPLYFAQIDAALTHIYLLETRPTEITRELERINKQYNDRMERLAHKMATATGKTPVMAMLILWQAANHYASGTGRPSFRTTHPASHPRHHRQRKAASIS